MSKVILLVEDERPLLEAIKDKLETKGLEVVSARTCDQALNYINDLDHIDLVWLDHYLIGEKSGLDFLVEVKSNDKWKKIPVFVVSNTAGPDAKSSYLKLGVDKYYVKADNKLDEIVNEVSSIL